MQYNFDEIINRRGTYSVKWDGGDLLKEMGFTERYDEETIPLFTADMDLPVAQPIIDALHRTVDHRIFGYSILPDTYFEAIQNWFKRRHDWDIKKESIVYSPGTVHALNVAVKAFTEPGDGVIIQRPVYPPFTAAVESNERVVVNNPLLKDDQGNYAIDFVDFEAKAKLESTKLFILCNPHNPTGRIFSNEDLKKLSDICKVNDVLIVADEIHGDLVRLDKTFFPIATVADDAKHIISLTAINKTFNVAGLHCTNVIIEDEAVRKRFSEVMGYQGVSPFAISTLIAAYNEGEEWLNQLKVYIDNTMQWIVDYLGERLPEVKVVIPEGTYILWLDFNGLGLTSEEVHDRIYNKANVLLEDGEMFGEEGALFQRICVPSPRPIIEEALERIVREFN